MPELPEVETVRAGLEGAVVGRRIDDVEVLGRRTVRRQSPAELQMRLVGRSFAAARRRGKYLLLGLDDDAVLVVHLRMSGQLLHVGDPSAHDLPAHTQVVARLGDGAELRFVDPRTFGEWFVAADLDARGVPAALAHLGRDPLIDGLPASYLARSFARRRAPLKALLTDQRIIAGIGNLYADEICHVARLRPDRPGGSLEAPEISRLAKAARAVLNSAVELRGSSLRDLRYRDIEGSIGSYQDRHAVYDRRGAPCPRCAAPIAKIRIGAKVAYCCEVCQQ